MLQFNGSCWPAQDNHVESEFYAYPVGGHFPSDPITQIDVWQTWADWLAKYLKP
jgi:dipeptidyl aminopeptidase/acylaminoacyl peptidase